MASINNELSGKTEYPGPNFVLNEKGEVYYPEYGSTLNELHEKARRLNPEQYSLVQEQADMLMQESIRNGATHVVTSYHRNDGDYKDVWVMKFDHNTGKGTTAIISTENKHSFDAIQSVAKDSFSNLLKIQPAKDVFILTDKPLPVHIANQAIDVVHYAGKQTMREVGHTVRSVQRYIERRHSRPVEDMRQSLKQSFTDRVKNMLRQKPKSVAEVKFIDHKKHTEVKRNKKKLPQALQTPQILLASEMKLRSRMIIPEMKKSIARHEKKAKRIKMKKEVRVLRKMEKKRTVQSKREQRVLLMEKRVLKKKKIVIEAKPMRQKEKVKTEKIVRLLMLAKKLIRKKERMDKIRLRRPEQRKREQVLDFALAFVWWIFLQKRSHVPLEDSKIKIRAISERLVQRELTRWILLAIIWHLTMIREGGMKTVQNLTHLGKTKQKKAKKNTFYPQFAPQGVIFAYAT